MGVSTGQVCRSSYRTQFIILLLYPTLVLNYTRIKTTHYKSHISTNITTNQTRVQLIPCKLRCATPPPACFLYNVHQEHDVTPLIHPCRQMTKELYLHYLHGQEFINWLPLLQTFLHLDEEVDTGDHTLDLLNLSGAKTIQVGDIVNSANGFGEFTA